MHSQESKCKCERTLTEPHLLSLLLLEHHSGTFFVLKQGQVSLLVSVARLPHLSLSEELVDFRTSKYKLEPNSESTV